MNKNSVLNKQSMNNTIKIPLSFELSSDLNLFLSLLIVILIIWYQSPFTRVILSITMVESNKMKALEEHKKQVDERIQVLH